jgi:2-polyprenyl-3-methyl-5-hydroxy-6-metoxy-1,4-benzoquinol methylase
MAVSEKAALATETVDSCVLCGSRQFRTQFEEPPYAVRRCSNCGLGWVSPRLDRDDLAEIYKSDQYWRSPSPKAQGYTDDADEQLYLATFRNRLRFVLKDGPGGGRALDVGCAAGFCMVGMRELGFETHGLEISEVIGSHAREYFGFGDAVYIGTLESSPYRANHFDLITMWDVVEHVPDPIALLRKARELLKPDGLLVIETQDIDSRFARTLGPRWHHYKHEEHIYHFTPATVRTLLAQAGFQTERLTHRLGGKYVSMSFIAERAARVHPAVTRVLMPLTRLRRARVYLNFMDEMIILARPS